MTEQEILKLYQPEIIKTDEFMGFATNFSNPSENALVLQKGFLSSLHPRQSQMISNGIRLFDPNSSHCNALLVLIRGGQSYIYKHFPISMFIRAKRDVKKGEPINRDQILDIEGIAFKDAIFEIEIKDQDKIFWLFRRDLNFGCYFDFTGKLQKNLIQKELGDAARKLEFHRIYSYCQEYENLPDLMKKGWFPFFQIVPTDFENLISTNEEDFSKAENHIISKYDKDRVELFTQYWWNNDIFKGKKKLLDAGIAAFLNNTPDNTINCIKNLIPEIEGIIRISFHKKNGRSPKTKELKAFLISEAKNSFTDENTLGFPTIFSAYLDNVLFKDFDLSDELPFSRHTIGHGVTPDDLFTRARALQCILILDQIKFYLGKSI